MDNVTKAPVDIGRRFLWHIISDEIFDACKQFIPAIIDRDTTVLPIATEAVRKSLIRSFQVDGDRIAIKAAFINNKLETMLVIKPGNLYTYLFITQAMLVAECSIDAKEYHTAAGIYYFRRGLGGFKPHKAET